MDASICPEAALTDATPACPLCAGPVGAPYATVAGHDYYLCEACDFIALSPSALAHIDGGAGIRSYGDDYWASELAAARERAWGPALARVAETLLYCRIPVRRFLDIGTGAGLLLEALAWHLPAARAVFHGVELFPPPPAARTPHANYHIGAVRDLAGPFDAGSCIEVIEHLTPRMLDGLVGDLAGVSARGACYIFNTGLTDYVRHEDPAYLDPVGRGHICVWSVTAARRVFEPHGFAVHPLPGKTWAFIAEYAATPPGEGTVADRIWTALPGNVALLRDPATGSVLHLLGMESARAYRD